MGLSIDICLLKLPPSKERFHKKAENLVVAYLQVGLHVQILALPSLFVEENISFDLSLYHKFYPIIPWAQKLS